MNSTISKARFASSLIALGVLIAPVIARAQEGSSTNDGDGRHRFQVSTTSFPNGGALSFSMVYDHCAPYPGGGNQSPELSWINAPHHTSSIVVVMYDVTASFSHWGMYNIDPTTTELPAGAGAPDSPFGLQVHNDFGRLNLEYDGPCPPPQLNPPVHRYVFTVYALDTTLTLPALPDFPPGAEALFQALIRAGARGHILAAASVSGFFPGR